jgi:hypothetical protein
MRHDHVRVTSRRNHRGLTTCVECDICGIVQPLVAPGRRTPSQPDIRRVIHLFGAMHDRSCKGHLATLVETMQAGATETSAADGGNP